MVVAADGIAGVHNTCMLTFLAGRTIRRKHVPLRLFFPARSYYISIKNKPQPRKITAMSCLFRTNTIFSINVEYTHKYNAGEGAI